MNRTKNKLNTLTFLLFPMEYKDSFTSYSKKTLYPATVGQTNFFPAISSAHLERE